MEITCPSGLSFRARFWNNADRRELTSAKNLRSGNPLITMISVVDEGCTNPGPYPTAEVGKPVPWGDMAIEDMMTALVLVRRSMRPFLKLEWTCSACGESQRDNFIDLRTLESEPFGPKALELLSDPEKVYEIEAPFTEAPDSPVDSVGLRILRGKDFPLLAQHQKRKSATEYADVQVVFSVVDVLLADGSVLDTFKTIWDRYSAAGWGYRDAINDGMSFLTKGVGVPIEAVSACEHCGHEEEILLPFDSEFFYPSSGKHGTKSGKRSGAEGKVRTRRRRG